jgi:hypothetical protein
MCPPEDKSWRLESRWRNSLSIVKKYKHPIFTIPPSKERDLRRHPTLEHPNSDCFPPTRPISPQAPTFGAPSRAGQSSRIPATRQANSFSAIMSGVCCDLNWSTQHFIFRLKDGVWNMTYRTRIKYTAEQKAEVNLGILNGR